jgi:inorganic triphosphatase YgiF
MEIEAKYRVAHRHVFEALLRMRNLGTFSLCPEPSLEHQTNTYYDTPEWALAAQRLNLRVRQVTDLRVATVKRSSGGVGAIHVREEWETSIAGDPHPIAWPRSALRDRMLALIGSTPLLALFMLSTRRQRIAVRNRSASIAELSLDEGYIQANGRILGFRELEIELGNHGTLDDLHQIAGLLVDHFALIPEPRGKRSRGMALLQALTEPYVPTVGAQRSREAIVW